MGIIAFIIIGLLAGLIARAIMPGKQSMGLIATTLLGMVGSLIGGFIGNLFTSSRSLFEINTAGILLSIVGALVALFVVQKTSARRHIRA